MEHVHVRLRVGDELYAVPIEHVLEITDAGDLAAVPGSGTGLLGVRNLRGRVLPVFDLARVFGLRREHPPTRILVTELHGDLAGLAVDEVTDVAPLQEDVEQVESEHLRCAVLENGSLVGVVDVGRLFAALGSETVA